MKNTFKSIKNTFNGVRRADDREIKNRHGYLEPEPTTTGGSSYRGRDSERTEHPQGNTAYGHRRMSLSDGPNDKRGEHSGIRSSFSRRSVNHKAPVQLPIEVGPTVHFPSAYDSQRQMVVERQEKPLPFPGGDHHLDGSLFLAQERALLSISDVVREAWGKLESSSYKANLDPKSYPREVERQVKEIVSLVNKYDYIINDLGQDVGQWKQRSEVLTAQYRDLESLERQKGIRISDLERQIDDGRKMNLQNLIDTRDMHKAEEQRLNEHWEVELDQRRCKDEAQIRKLEGNVTQLEGQKTEMQNAHAIEKNKLRTEHEKQLNAACRSVRTELGAIIDRLQGDNALIKAGELTKQRLHEENIAKVKHNLLSQHTEEMNKLNNEILQQEAGKRALEKRHNDELADGKRELRALKAKHDDEMRRVELKHKSDLEAALRQSKADVEALKGALVAREHVKVMTDHQLSTRFRDIAGEIDEYARVRWDGRKEADWPLPQNVLRRSENERRLKQHIIQSDIWVLLHEHIFCTPFRVFGAAGKELDREWAAKFPPDCTDKKHLGWPKPSRLAEEWRYGQAKQCLATLEQQVPESDPEHKLKKSFARTLSTMAEKLADMLGMVSSVDIGTLPDMEEFAKKAAMLWVEMETQRCRFLVVVPDDTEKLLSGEGARRDPQEPIELLLRPEVRRIGNSQGEELGRMEVVIDCKGESSRFHP